MKRWYAVYTHAQAEAAAALHLARQGFETYLPRCARNVRHARRTTTVAAPLFPRYLFVALDPEHDRWRAVASTVGVSRLVCRGDVPAAIPDAVVDEVRAREDGDGMVALDDGLRLGASVSVTTGPLREMTGLFTARHDARVVVLLSLLGRQVAVRLPAGAVAACA